MANLEDVLSDLKELNNDEGDVNSKANTLLWAILLLRRFQVLCNQLKSTNDDLEKEKEELEKENFELRKHIDDKQV